MREPLPARLGAPGAPARCGYAESRNSPRDSLLASGFWLQVAGGPFLIWCNSAKLESMPHAGAKN